jgi:hypothetical protein
VKTVGFTLRALNILRNALESFLSQKLYGIHPSEFANVIRIIQGGSILYPNPMSLLEKKWVPSKKMPS